MTFGRVLLLTLLLAATAARATRAQDVDEAKAAKVKAAYLYNFLRFTAWPAGSFEHEGSPIVLTVVGDAGLADLLESLVAQERIDGRRVVVRRVRFPELEGDEESDRRRLGEWFGAVRRGHALYVGASDGRHASSIITGVRGAAVLTVGDTPGFAEAGGMLGLVVREGRIVFDANPRAIERARVTVSSKVLRLARIVEPPRGERGERREP